MISGAYTEAYAIVIHGQYYSPMSSARIKNNVISNMFPENENKLSLNEYYMMLSFHQIKNGKIRTK